MKKIIFYIGSLARGGAQRVIVNLANRLSQCGYSCIVITSYKAKNEYLLNDNVQRITLVRDEKTGFIKRNALQFIGLRKIVKDEKPQFVISFMGEPNFRMLLATIGLKCKKLISVRNDPNREYPSLIHRILAKSVFNLSDKVVFQTEDAKRWFPKSLQEKSDIILNPVDDVFFETQYKGNRKNIVAVGRLVSQKNHKMLINAFSKIANQVDDNLIIYGDGELKLSLQNQIVALGMEKRIFLPGLVSDIHEKIKSAKLFVLSSDYEGLPNSLMEAMALGIPCVSTDCPCGGPRMLLRDEALFPVNDEQRLSQVMLRQLSEKNEKAFLLDPSDFSMEKTMDKWKAFLEK